MRFRIAKRYMAILRFSFESQNVYIVSLRFGFEYQNAYVAILRFEAESQNGMRVFYSRTRIGNLYDVQFEFLCRIAK